MSRSMKLPRFYVGDTETTGLPGKGGKVCEIAWLEIDEGFNVLDTVRSLINPEHPIPADMSAIHGITDKHVDSAPTIDEFMDGFMFANAEGESVLVAHNSSFDIQFFQPYMPNLIGTVCTLKMARAFLKDAPNNKLQTLKFHLDLEADVAHHEAHTALADCKVTLELLRHLNLATGMTLTEMLEFCAKPEPAPTHWPWGKYRGKPLGIADMSYVKWALKNMDNMSADLRVALEKL